MRFKRQELTQDIVPWHIAIIMDGNGRWAKTRGLPRSAGHRAGADTLHKIVKYASEIGVGILTVYAFSTENWKRSKAEIDALMQLLTEYLGKAERELSGKNVQIRVIGDKTALPQELQDEICRVEGLTTSNDGLILNIALNYGGRLDILEAARNLARKVQGGELSADEIEEDVFSQALYTRGDADPDIIIRPSGELRISNFLLWQAAYSEFWFSSINWPDFDPRDLDAAIVDVAKRNRRFGGV